MANAKVWSRMNEMQKISLIAETRWFSANFSLQLTQLELKLQCISALTINPSDVFGYLTQLISAEYKDI